jgi:hypothetical protein
MIVRAGLGGVGLGMTQQKEPFQSLLLCKDRMGGARAMLGT